MTTTKTGRKVQGIIYSKTDSSVHILCLHRTPEEGNFWQPLTGTVEENETYQECLVRELQEETGIDEKQILSIEGPINGFEWTRNDTLYKEEVYAVCVPAETCVVLCEEHDEYNWFTPESAKEILKFKEIKDGVDILLNGTK